MECQECARLRAKLSPLEDPSFTADYLLVEPVEWLREQRGSRQNGTPLIIVHAAELFQEAFGHKPDHQDTMMMGRTLKAMGWEQSKHRGITKYIMTKEEFDATYPL
jgi:hypothetical protein